jgi:hypothetical protein
VSADRLSRDLETAAHLAREADIAWYDRPSPAEYEGLRSDHDGRDPRIVIDDFRPVVASHGSGHRP